MTDPLRYIFFMVRLSPIILIYFLLAISLSFANASGDKDECVSALFRFVTKSEFISHQSFINKITIPVSLSKKDSLYKALKELVFTDDEVADFISGLNRFQNVNLTVMKELPSYLLYVKSLTAKERKIALLDIFQLEGAKPTSKFVKHFFSVKKKLEKFKIKESKKIKKANPLIGRKELEKLVGRQASKYEKLVYGCSARSWTPERKAGAKNFTRFVISVGLISTSGAYIYNNRDSDLDSEWFGRLGYELTYNFISSRLVGWFTSNPLTSATTKGFVDYAMSRTVGISDVILYSIFFGVSQDEAKTRMEEVLNDDDKMEKVRELVSKLDEKLIYDKYKEIFLNQAKKLLAGLKDESVHTDEISKINWNELTEQDLQNKKIQEMLLQAINKEIYEESNDGWLKTGMSGIDRYSFNALFGIPGTAVALGVNLYIYKTLCLGALNPKMALLQAVSLYTLNKVIFDQVYFRLRTDATGH